MKLIIKMSAIVVLAWLLAGAPIGSIRIKPMTPNPDAPVFDPEMTQANREEAQENLNSGSYKPDADQEDMRSRIEETFSSLQNDPCNDDLRKEFSKALALYLKHKKKLFDRDEETSAEEKILDQDTIGIFTVAVEEGYIGKADLPWAFRDMAPNSRAIACQRESAQETDYDADEDAPEDEPEDADDDPYDDE